MSLEQMGTIGAVIAILGSIFLVACGNGQTTRNQVDQFISNCDTNSIKVAMSDDGRHKTMLISCARID